MTILIELMSNINGESDEKSQRLWTWRKEVKLY